MKKVLTNKTNNVIIIIENKKGEIQMKKSLVNLLKLILGGVIGTTIIFSAICIMQIVVNIIANNFWLIIPLIIAVAILTYKEAIKNSK